MSIDNNQIIGHILGTFEALYGNYLLVAIVALFLGIATYTDIKSLKIPNTLNLFFAILTIPLFILFGYDSMDFYSFFGGALFAFLALLIPAMIRMHPMGGDIKCLTVVGFYLGIEIMPFFIAITCFLGMVYIGINFALKRVTGNMPFAPFFMATHIVLALIALVI